MHDWSACYGRGSERRSRMGTAVAAGLSSLALPVEVTDHCFRVDDLAGVDPCLDFLCSEPAHLDAFVFHRGGLAPRQICRPEDSHLLRNLTRAWIENHQILPLFCAV